MKLGRRQCRCASHGVADEETRGRVKDIYMRRPAAADEESRGGAMLGPMASACEQRAESRKERGGGERRAATFTRAEQRRRREKSAQRRSDRGVAGVGVRRVADNDVDDSGRRRRRRWRGLCGAGEGFRSGALGREGTRTMVFSILPFLCCDRSATDQVCR
ncbi:hypothetical protein Scep_014907 [Stephania cephalantha]|uniref:Uncharacterized protein n=1 Tax=Stephania cephalantha TaxID=152367 RepID=A0AAP0J4R2_9MAGN